MKQLEICYVNGNGIIAHFSDHEKADQLLDFILEGYQSMVEGQAAPDPVAFEADDAKGIIHFQELCFIKLTDVEVHSMMVEHASETLEQAPRKH